MQGQDYYAFGKRRGILTGGVNKYFFNGKEMRDELGGGTHALGSSYTLEGQYDFGARFYDAEIGRWAVVDPLADHPNQYDRSPYAGFWNNPVRYTDPDGRCPECEENVSNPYDGQEYTASDGSVFYYSEESGQWTQDGGTISGVAVTRPRTPLFFFFGNGEEGGYGYDADRRGMGSLLNAMGHTMNGIGGAAAGLSYNGSNNIKLYTSTIKPSPNYGFKVYLKPGVQGAIGSSLGRTAGAAGVLISTLTVVDSWREEGYFGQQTKIELAKAGTSFTAVWAGAKIGAAAFGAAGSIIPGAGTGAGIIIGGILGGIGGGLGASWLVGEVYK